MASVNTVGFEKFKNALIKQKRRQEKAQKRIEQDNERTTRLALLPVLEWFSENAEQEETREAARVALEGWDQPINRGAWLTWGMESGYMSMVQRAYLNPPGFRKLVRIAPQTVIEARMNGWVLEAIELLSQGNGVSKKKLGAKKRRR